MFKLVIDETGNSPLDDFRDLLGDVDAFRGCLKDAFEDAEKEARKAREENSQKEVWDRTCQTRFRDFLGASQTINRQTKFILEKDNFSEVSKVGLSLFKVPVKGERLWTLPDGIVLGKEGEKPVALEFDHGNSAGNWADKLLKGCRNLASDQISGLLYCYCFENPKHYRETNFTQLSEEYLTIIKQMSFYKRIGIITINYEPAE